MTFELNKYTGRFLLLAAVSALLLAALSCSKESELRSDIVGEWHYCDADADVFLAFSGTGDYELFQRIGDGRYRGYTGKWTLKKDILSGSYAEGISWGSSYKLSIGSGTMTLTAVNGSGEKNVYRRENIPYSVRETAILQK